MKTAHERSVDHLGRIIPKMHYDGGDIETWKKEARAKLSELLALHKFTKVSPEIQIEYEQKIEGATEIRFTFKSEDDYRVPCHLLLPDGIENPPVMICLQGHSTGMHISLARPKYEGDEETIKGGDRDFCIRAVKEGYAAVAIEQRNFGESRGGMDKFRCGEAAHVALLLGRTTIGERVWDVMRLIDVLEAEFGNRVDTNTISCMGNSGGGTTTSYVMALEDRIKLAMPSCCINTYKDSIGSIVHCGCNFIPGIAEYFEMDDLISMAYPKYYVQVNGIDDQIFPIEKAEEMFDSGKKTYVKYGVGDRCALVKGKGGHRFFADDSWPHVHKYLKK